jgi:molecular chaperone GrpE
MTSDKKTVPPEPAEETPPVPDAGPEAGGGEAPEAAAPSEADEQAALESRLRDAEERYVRLYAEFENYKKRTARENEEFRRYANEGVLKEMLPVLDNFERAVSHAKEASEAAEGESGGLLEGVELIRKQFLDVLGKLGVTPIEAVGTPFDPQVHQAVSQMETADAAAGTVVNELQRGFFYRERVLRPAMVVVARGPEGADAPAQG